MLSGWEFFKIYLALDLHFTTEKYDVFKYKGRVNVNAEKFAIRNDARKFEYWANKVKKKDLAGRLCIANFVHGEDNWVYSTFDEAEPALKKLQRIKESQTKFFTDDLSAIKGIMSGRVEYDNMFDKTASGRLPPLLQVYLSNKISAETLVIMNKEDRSFFDYWYSICDNDPYAKKKILTLKKYEPFVKYDAAKIKDSIVNCRESF